MEEQAVHDLRLYGRRKLTMNGVSEVVSFQEDAVVLQTALGTLIVQGRELQLQNLSLEGGQVDVEGAICALQYEEPKESAGWRRLFR